MTDPNIKRPGLRVAAAAEKLNLDDNDIVVVVQGDGSSRNDRFSYSTFVR